jgi:hypothetical protein
MTTITYTPSQDLKDKFEKFLETLAPQESPLKEICLQYVTTLVSNDVNSFIQQQNLTTKKRENEDDINDKPKKIQSRPTDSDFYNQILFPDKITPSRGRWKSDDENTLLELVSIQTQLNSKINWSEIAKRLPGRSADGCQVRYYKIMCKKNNK